MKTTARAVAAAMLSTLVLAAGCGGDSDSDTSTAAEAPAAGAPEAGAGAPASQPGGGVDCVYTASDGGGGAKKATPPEPKAQNDAPSYATVTTNKGKIVIELDAPAAPCTVHSFISLAKQNYYDGSPCHRLLDQSSGGTTYAVLQCGDPTGTGLGGPGYTFADENLDGAKYLKGVVAMANSGANTNGSQFFMMFKDSDFSPDYAPFGRILSGVAVLQKVAKGGRSVNKDTGAQDVPKTKLVIEKVSIGTDPPPGAK